MQIIYVEQLITLTTADCFKNDIDTRSQWCAKNLLPLNISKCTQVTYALKISDINSNFIIRNTPVNKCILKILESLTFRRHIATVVQANGTLDFILHNAKFFSEIYSIKLLYNACVRSELEYA